MAASLSSLVLVTMLLRHTFTCYGETIIANVNRTEERCKDDADCVIRCGTTGTEGHCESKSLYCPNDPHLCTVICSGEESCYLADIHWHNVGVLSFAGVSAVKHVTFPPPPSASPLYIHCNASYVCEWSKIHCPDNADCTIYCTSKDSCRSSDIYCPSNGTCAIICDDSYSCGFSSINCPSNGDCALSCTADDACSSVSVTWSPSSYSNHLECNPTSACPTSLSLRPTSVPTQPSVDPTKNPTNDPSHAPSTKPSIDPTARPSANPSVSPTIHPSLTPSMDPTRYPFITPTSNPSTDPTVRPSDNPTVNPTINPSVNPTVYPSMTPSVYPTVDPSITPTTPSPTLIVGSNKTPSPTKKTEQQVIDNTETTDHDHKTSHAGFGTKTKDDDKGIHLMAIIFVLIAVVVLLLVLIAVFVCRRNKSIVPRQPEHDVLNIADMEPDVVMVPGTKSTKTVNMDEIELAELPHEQAVVENDSEEIITDSEGHEGLYADANQTTTKRATDGRITKGTKVNTDDDEDSSNDNDDDDALYSERNRMITAKEKASDEEIDLEDSSNDNVLQGLYEVNADTKTKKT
eukprot:269677_1